MTGHEKAPKPAYPATKLPTAESARVEESLDPILAFVHGAARRAENKHGLTVPCPTCGALEGARRLTGSGSVRKESHLGRRIAASGPVGPAADK
jgi:hypothetical protein